MKNMRTVSDTSLETFQFGDKPEDKYYLLIDLIKNENGIDLARLTNADPRMFDTVLNEMGCVLMLSGDEMGELIRRGDVAEGDMHASLFKLAQNEGLL